MVLGTAWGWFCLPMTFILSFPFGSMTAPGCLMRTVLTGPSFHAASDGKHFSACYLCLLVIGLLFLLSAVGLAEKQKSF